MAVKFAHKVCVLCLTESNKAGRFGQAIACSDADCSKMSAIKNW